MEIFVLVCEYTNVDSGDFDTSVIGAYRTFGEAQEEMEKQMVEIRKDYDYCDTEEDNYVEGDMGWSIWEKEGYAYNHCLLTIQSVELGE